MLSKKKYTNTSISPGTAGKYVRKDSPECPSRMNSDVSQKDKRPSFNIAELPLLNPSALQPAHAFRRDGRDRHPIKRGPNLMPGAQAAPKALPTAGPRWPAPTPTPTVTTDPFLKVSPYTAPVAMLSTQMPSQVTVGVAQPVHLMRPPAPTPPSMEPPAEGSAPPFGAFPPSMGINARPSLTGSFAEPLVPPNPMYQAEIPEWIKVYVTAHPRHDDKLQWDMFSLAQLSDFDLMVKWQRKREVEEVVLAYERCRTALISEMHRRKIDASRYGLTQ